MSAPHYLPERHHLKRHLPKRHLNLLTNFTSQKHQDCRPASIADRFCYLLDEIESFLLTCTYDEICKFWNAIDNLRQYFQNFQKRTQQSEVPNFLNHRRQKRDFCRILEVLADLSYPKLHLSNHPER
jgi:hypothetical protein